MFRSMNFARHFDEKSKFVANYSFIHSFHWICVESKLGEKLHDQQTEQKRLYRIGIECDIWWHQFSIYEAKTTTRLWRHRRNEIMMNAFIRLVIGIANHRCINATYWDVLIMVKNTNDDFFFKENRSRRKITLWERCIYWLVTSVRVYNLFNQHCNVVIFDKRSVIPRLEPTSYTQLFIRASIESRWSAVHFQYAMWIFHGRTH